MALRSSSISIPIIPVVPVVPVVPPGPEPLPAVGDDDHLGGVGPAAAALVRCRRCSRSPVFFAQHPKWCPGCGRTRGGKRGASAPVRRICTGRTNQENPVGIGSVGCGSPHTRAFQQQRGRMILSNSFLQERRRLLRRTAHPPHP
eukprot:GHVU01206458.1.p1 GENE.GHVU01206458.1~~GHVU01206458.1.p1  ORF type:complete len:145 (+),score=6.55 GHVU01206458.1:253-687(+)